MAVIHEAGIVRNAFFGQVAFSLIEIPGRVNAHPGAKSSRTGARSADL
jgi:hypothetical protein